MATSCGRVLLSHLFIFIKHILSHNMRMWSSRRANGLLVIAHPQLHVPTNSAQYFDTDEILMTPNVNYCSQWSLTQWSMSNLSSIDKVKFHSLKINFDVKCLPLIACSSLYIISFHYILLTHNANKDCSCSSPVSLHIGSENNSTLIEKSNKQLCICICSKSSLH